MQAKLLLTPVEAAWALSISRSLAYELMRDGQLSYLKINSRRKIPLAAIEQLIAQRITAQGAGNQQETTTSPEQNGGEK